MEREEDTDVLLAHIAARDLDEPDLLQFHEVTRQLPLVLPECCGLHAEVELDGATGISLLRQSRVGQLRAGANLLALQQPEGDEGPCEEVVDVEVCFQSHCSFTH